MFCPFIRKVLLFLTLGRIGVSGLLCCNPGAAREDVQRNAFAQEELSHGALDDGADCHGLDLLSFCDFPLDAERGLVWVSLRAFGS